MNWFSVLKNGSSELELLIITPLKHGDKVSEETKKMVKKNSVDYEWVTIENDGNPAHNTSLGYEIWNSNNSKRKKPKYIMKLDNDINSDKPFIDVLVNSLNNSNDNEAYAYCGFEFTGAINVKFPAVNFDPYQLIMNNYISFNSVIKREALDSIGGFITDDKYFRLLDWALWLKFLKNGYIGKPSFGVSFTAHASKGSVSAGSAEDYKIKHKAVYDDFINKILIQP